MSKGYWAEDIKARNGCGPGPYIELSEYDALLAELAKKDARITQLEIQLSAVPQGGVDNGK